MCTSKSRASAVSTAWDAANRARDPLDGSDVALSACRRSRLIPSSPRLLDPVV